MAGQKKKEEEPEVKAEKLIYVKAAPAKRPRADGGDTVALWERNSAHPGGEVFVSGDKPVAVATTGEVSKLLRDGTLIEVGAAEVAAWNEAHPSSQVESVPPKK